VIPRDQACSGRGGPGRSQECVNADAPLVILVGHDPVDRIPDDRRKGHMPVARLSAQASHLVLSQGDLRSYHAKMITVVLAMM
jgi:hypothetical protein